MALADSNAKLAGRSSGALKGKARRLPSKEVRAKISEILADHCLNAAGLDPNVPEDLKVREHAKLTMQRMTEAQMRAILAGSKEELRPDPQHSPGAYNDALCNTVRTRAGLLGIAAFRYRAWRHSDRAVDIVYDEVKRQRRLAKAQAHTT